MKEFIVKKEDVNIRLDRYLSIQNEESSRVAIQRWIEEEKVVVNGKKANFLYGYTYEMAYAKLVMAYSVFEKEEDRKAFLENEYNFELVDVKN